MSASILNCDSFQMDIRQVFVCLVLLNLYAFYALVLNLYVFYLLMCYMK